MMSYRQIVISSVHTAHFFDDAHHICPKKRKRKSNNSVCDKGRIVDACYGNKTPPKITHLETNKIIIKY